MTVELVALLVSGVLIILAVTALLLVLLARDRLCSAACRLAAAAIRTEHRGALGGIPMDLLGYPPKPGHYVTSTTYGEGLMALAGQGQRIDLR
jgi:hypothetical protein